MVGRVSSYGVVQVPGGQATIIGRVTAAGTGLYTVPAGKVTKVFSGSMVLDAVGADATYAVAIHRGATIIPLGAFVAVGGKSTVSGPIILQAGDIFSNIGDAGSTNGTCDQSVTIQEFDV